MRNRFLLLSLVSFLVLSSCKTGTTDKTAADSVKVTDSMEYVNTQLRKDPGNLDLYLKRSKLEMQKKDYAASLADMNRIIAIDSSKAEYLIAAADIYFFVGKVGRTKQLLERAVEIHPENVDCLLRLAQLDHYLTKYDDELVLINKALKVDVHNAQAYFMKGMLFKEKHDTLAALSSMQTAVEQDPDYYNAYIQLGLLSAARKLPIAESYYLNAIKINPNSEEALYNLGMYYQETDNYNGAIETYTALLKVNPHNFDAHFNLGMIHLVKLKVTDEGMKYFNLAIEDNPKEPRGYYGRGFCFETKGDITNAAADYETALKLDPDYTYASMALARVRK